MDYVFSDRLKNLSGNAIREIFKLVNRPEVISFAGGLPASECLPVELFEKFAQEILAGKEAVSILQYGATEGYLPFRQAMINYVKRTGIDGITLDNVLAISGGQQGIDLSIKAFMNKGDVILVEDPTYLAVLHIAKTYETVQIGVKSDGDGVNIEDLEQKIIKYKPKIFYIVPNFQNPTGKTLTLEKRIAVAQLAAKYNIIVLEDDPYRELRYSGMPQPSIKSLDVNGNVIYITSFSKTISPGSRMGAVIADEKIIKKLTIGKQAVDVHTSTLSLAIAEKFINGDTLDNSVKRYIPIYREKRDAMIAAIEKYMPDNFRFTRPEGGLFIWGEFPKDSGINVVERFKEAILNNVAYVPGNDFFADGNGTNCMRLNFSNASIENINEGIKRLSVIFKKQQG